MKYYRLEIEGYGMFCSRSKCGYSLTHGHNEIINEIGFKLARPEYKLLVQCNYKTKSWLTEKGYLDVKYLMDELINTLNEYCISYELLIREIDEGAVVLVDDDQILENLNYYELLEEEVFV